MIREIEFANAANRIILNLDEMSPDPRSSAAKSMNLIEFFSVGKISPYVHSVRVGSDFIMLYKSTISIIRDREIGVFLDGKFFCDTEAIIRIAENIFHSGTKMFSIQAACGTEAMKAVSLRMEEMAISKVMNSFFFGDLKLEHSSIPSIRVPKGMADVINKALENKDFYQDQVHSAIVEANKIKPTIVAETIPCSFSEKLCYSIFGGSSLDRFKKFVTYTKNAGLDGIICPSHILRLLKQKECLKDLFVIVPDTVPGWILDWFSVPDKKSNPGRYIKAPRNLIMTPGEAINAGASAVVLGPSLTDPPQKKLSFSDVLELTIEEIHSAIKEEQNKGERIRDIKTIIAKR